MARKSRLLQVLRLAEDFLYAFDDYFKSTSWVYHHSGLSRQTKLESKKYLRQNNILLPDDSLDLAGKTVYSLIAKPWDKKWRMVCFDIPEKNRKLRNKIRRSLKQLGFKNLQRSMWISPLPIDDFIQKIKKKLPKPSRLTVMVGELKWQSSEKLVEEFWDLDSWREEALNLLDKMRKTIRLDAKLEKRFWQIISAHPKLPMTLLPNNWPLNRVIAEFTLKANQDG